MRKRTKKNAISPSDMAIVIWTALACRQKEVESAIEDQVRQGTLGAEVDGEFRGRVRVGDREIEYRGYGRGGGRIEIGTYYPVN